MGSNMTPQQIKFRGFRTETNEPVYGNLLYSGTDYLIREIEHDKGFHKSYFVEPESVGMFTGRTDKNGKEIYGAIGERGGDVVSFGRDLSYIVKFKNGSFEIYHTKYNPTLRWGLLSRVSELMWDDIFEIIGNQWEVENGKV